MIIDYINSGKKRYQSPIQNLTKHFLRQLRDINYFWEKDL